MLLGGRLREAEILFREALVMAEDNFGADSGLKALCNSFVGYCLHLKGDAEGSNRLIDSVVDTTDGWVDVFATAYEVRGAAGLRARRLERGGGARRTGGQVARGAQAATIEFHGGRMARGAPGAGRPTRGSQARSQRRRGVRRGRDPRCAPISCGGCVWRQRWRLRGSGPRSVPPRRHCNSSDSARVEFRTAGLLLPAYRLDALSVVILKQRGAPRGSARPPSIVIGFRRRRGRERNPSRAGSRHRKSVAQRASP